MWWAEMIVKNIKTGEFEPSNNCAVSKLPGLMVEMLRNTNGVQEAVESARNESVRRQDALLGIITSTKKALR
jgi:hypothetical protein